MQGMAEDDGMSEGKQELGLLCSRVDRRKAARDEGWVEGIEAE